MLELSELLLAGAVAGGLGATLGIGGGVLLVPLLNAVFGLPFHQAAAASLVGVLATAGSVSVSSRTRHLLNVRLAVVLLLFSVPGALIGGAFLDVLSDVTYKRVFGVTAAAIAVLMLARLDKRNVRPADIDTGALGARLFDDDTQTVMAYRVIRIPLACAVALAAGMLSTLIGIGGGIVIVPALNSLCGVPMRAAAATSAFMVGITAVPGAIAHESLGNLGDLHVAAGAALGVFAGYQAGIWVATRAPVRALKILMAVVLLVIAARYLV